MGTRMEMPWTAEKVSGSARPTQPMDLHHLCVDLSCRTLSWVLLHRGRRVKSFMCIFTLKVLHDPQAPGPEGFSVFEAYQGQAV